MKTNGSTGKVRATGELIRRKIEDFKISDEGKTKDEEAVGKNKDKEVA